MSGLEQNRKYFFVPKAEIWLVWAKSANKKYLVLNGED